MTNGVPAPFPVRTEMLRIPCPFCGERAHTEFTYGGDASAHRPTDPAAQTLASWLDYIYLRINPKGERRELWQHTSGCRRWIEVTRNAADHSIRATKPAGRLGE